MPFSHNLSWFLAIVVFCTRAVAGEEQAVLTDGSKVLGVLGEDPTGRIAFTPNHAASSIPAALLRKITFPAAAVPVSPSKPLWRLKLWSQGQILTGRVSAFQPDRMTFDFLALGPREISRAIVEGIHSPATQLALVYHDFEGAAPGWEEEGKDFRFDDERSLSGRRSLRLQGDQATPRYRVARPVESGRVELSFWDDGIVRARWQWLVEAEFISATGPQRLRIVLGWNAETFGLEAPDGPSLAVQQLRRREDWRRLRLFFTRHRLLILIDDAVLTVGEGPSGPLRAIRVRRRQVPISGQKTQQADSAPGPGEVYLDDFTIHRSVDSLMHPRRQWDQDELLLESGDQLFGEVQALDDHEVGLAGLYGKVRVPWSELRGVMFRRRRHRAQPIEGVLVRLRFQTRSESKPQDWDTLEGALVSATPEHLVLRHPYLGELKVPRRLAREMEVVYSGWRLEIDPAYHYLGEPVQNVNPSLPLAEGSRLAAEFHLEKVPDRPGSIALYVEDLEGMGAGATYREELEQGHLRTDLYLNGRKIDYLNRHLERRSRLPQRVRIAIPKDVLRQGENTLELRQRPISYDDDYDNFQLFGLAIEVDAAPSTRK